MFKKNLIIFLIFFSSHLLASPSIAIITNQGEDSLAIVDLDQMKVIKKIETDNSPLAIQFINNNRAVISNTKSQSLQVLDEKQLKIIKQLDIGFTPLGMIFVESNNKLYVSSWFESLIYIFDTNSWKITGTINVGKTPSGIVYNTAHELIISANRDENAVQIIKNDNVIKTIPVGEHPFGVFTEGNYAYSVNVYSNTVTEINLNNFKTVTFKVGSHPYNLVRYKENIYVTNTQDDTVSVIDAKTKLIKLSLKTGGVPENIDIDIGNNYLVVTSWGDDCISIFNLDTMKLIKHIPTGKESRSFGKFINTKR